MNGAGQGGFETGGNTPPTTPGPLPAPPEFHFDQAQVAHHAPIAPGRTAIFNVGLTYQPRRQIHEKSPVLALPETDAPRPAHRTEIAKC